MNSLVLLGSLRVASTNRQLAETAVGHLPDDVTATVFERLADVPHYSEDLDHDDRVPEAARELRAAIAHADAVLLVTPEYNGSISGAVKNAVDWASRPRGAAALAGVPAAVIGASASPNAAQWARDDGVRVLRVAGADVLDETVGVASSFQAFADGRLADPALDAELEQLVTRLVDAARANHAAA